MDLPILRYFPAAMLNLKESAVCITALAISVYVLPQLIELSGGKGIFICFVIAAYSSNNAMIRTADVFLLKETFYEKYT